MANELSLEETVRRTLQHLFNAHINEETEQVWVGEHKIVPRSNQIEGNSCFALHFSICRPDNDGRVELEETMYFPIQSLSRIRNDAEMYVKKMRSSVQQSQTYMDAEKKAEQLTVWKQALTQFQKGPPPRL